MKEHFGLLGNIFGGLASGGNKTSIDNKTNINKNFENNQRINRSMAVESITKLINNIASDVIQKNTASAASAVSASNTIWLQGINCDEVVITGINQKGTVISDTQIKIQQSNKSKISNEISTNIDKTIEKIGATDLNELEATNTKMLNEFMGAMPGYDPNKAQQLASKCSKGEDSMISIANECKVSNEYNLNESVKKTLDLDESFKIKDTDDVSNDIKNKVEQANFASCKSSAAANNAIILTDITCDAAAAMAIASKIDKTKADEQAGKKPKKNKLEISDVQQEAIAKLYMTCIFDQKNVNEIANKIVNKISKKYNQIYDAVKEKAKKNGPEYEKNAIDFLDVWSAAGIEKIAAAAGNLPKTSKNPTKEINTETKKTDEKTEENKDELNRTPNFSSELPGIKKDDSIPTKSDDDIKKEIERKNKAIELQKKRELDEKKELDDYNMQVKSDKEKNDKKIKDEKDKAEQLKNDKKIKDEQLKNELDKQTADKLAIEQENQYIVYGGIGLAILIIFLVIMYFV